MSEADDTKGRPRTARWVKIALAVSLALNLGVVGVISGVMLDARGGPREAPALRTLGLGPFARALPRGHRDELRGRIEGQGEPLREERRAIGQSLHAVQATLRAEPFDRAAAEAAFARSRALAASLQESGQRALLDQIETMTAAERASLADELGRMMRRSGPGRR